MKHILVAAMAFLVAWPASAATLCTRNGISIQCDISLGKGPNHHVITWTHPQQGHVVWSFTYGGANNVWVSTPNAENLRGTMSWVDPGTYRVIRVDFTSNSGNREVITYPSPKR